MHLPKFTRGIQRERLKVKGRNGDMIGVEPQSVTCQATFLMGLRRDLLRIRRPPGWRPTRRSHTAAGVAENCGHCFALLKERSVPTGWYVLSASNQQCSV